VALAVRTDAPPQPGEDGQSPAWQRVARRQRGPRPPLPVGVLMTVWVLAGLSGLAIWFLFYAFSLSGFGEESAQHALYAQLRSEIAQEVAPPFGGNKPSDDIGLGSPVAMLRVPQAGIKEVVLEGTTAGVLEQGPGLLADSPLPGQPGVSEILGRQTMFGGPFRHLDLLQAGDPIQVTTGEGTFRYVVDDLRYSGQPIPTPPTVSSRMILITAAGSGWHGAGSPNQVLYVDASLRGNPAGSAPGLPTAVPANQTLMQGDPSVLFPLVLWLQLLLLTVCAMAWVRSRWGGWQTWLVGVPVILAVLWVVSETAFQLLPNLL
jgi:sortase A